MSDSSDEDIKFTPAELVEVVSNADLSFLPEKSREKYLKAYDLFNVWRHSKGAKTFSEAVLLSYFKEISKTRQSSTLWSIYSMLKATIKSKSDVHIETYSKLIAFLKRKSSGHKPKKSRVFTASNIEKFLTEAPDCNFLATKVVLIIGISGACRSTELTYLTIKNIEKHSEKLLLINLPNTKMNIDRTFVIREEYVKIVEKYQSLRPANTPIDRFFLQYRNGKCVKQPMGSTKIGGLPREIATFLNLPEPQLYTGHCFRRTSATLMADLGADLTTLKRHGGCKSNTVAGGHIEDSFENKSKICKGMAGAIKLKQPCIDPQTCSYNSKDSIESSSASPAHLPHSPTFTIMESNRMEQDPENNLLKNNTQVTNTSITVLKKNGNEVIVSEYEKCLAEITALKGQVLKLESSLLESQIRSPLKATPDTQPELDYWKSYCEMLKEENVQLTIRVNNIESSPANAHQHRVNDLEQTILTLRGLVSKFQAEQKSYQSHSPVHRRMDSGSRPGSAHSGTDKGRNQQESYRVEIANLKRTIQDKDLLLEKSKEMLKIAAEREEDLLRENTFLRRRLDDLTKHSGGSLSA